MFLNIPAIPAVRLSQAGRLPKRFLNLHYSNCWIGRCGPETWPPMSPDFTPFEYFLCERTYRPCSSSKYGRQWRSNAACNAFYWRYRWNDKVSQIQLLIIIIIIILPHGLGRLTCSGIDALPSFPVAPTISSSSRLVFEGVFRQSGVFHSFKVVDPVVFVFESHVLFSTDL